MSDPRGDRDAEIASLIRREIAKAEDRARRCMWPKYSNEETAAKYEVIGMRRVLAFIDPDPHK